MSDISLTVGGVARRMTYAELAEARGVSIPAARRLTLRHRWANQPGNDGLVRVSVPLSALEKPRESAALHDATTDTTLNRNDGTSDAVSATTRSIRVCESAVEGLREQLAIANQRADGAEERADREGDRANRLEQQLTAVECELISARAEAAGLRYQLEQARPKPVADSLRSPWRRFLAWRRGR